MNTKFFHNSTIIRRKKKNEDMLDGNHQWEFDQVKLKELAVGFYEELYKADQNAGAISYRLGSLKLGMKQYLYLVVATLTRRFILL